MTVTSDPAELASFWLCLVSGLIVLLSCPDLVGYLKSVAVAPVIRDVLIGGRTASLTWQKQPKLAKHDQTTETRWREIE